MLLDYLRHIRPAQAIRVIGLPRFIAAVCCALLLFGLGVYASYQLLGAAVHSVGHTMPTDNTGCANLTRLQVHTQTSPVWYVNDGDTIDGDRGLTVSGSMSSDVAGCRLMLFVYTAHDRTYMFDDAQMADTTGTSPEFSFDTDAIGPEQQTGPVTLVFFAGTELCGARLHSHMLAGGFVGPPPNAEFPIEECVVARTVPVFSQRLAGT